MPYILAVICVLLLLRSMGIDRGTYVIDSYKTAANALYFEAYEAVISMTSSIVAKYQKYGITFARMENPTLEEAARQLKVLAKLLNEGDELGILNGDSVMKSVNANGYAHAVEQISIAFSAGNEEEVHRIISELNERSIL